MLDKLSDGFPSIPYTKDLLDAMKAQSNLKTGLPSDSVTTFLSQIDNADPTSSEYLEDDLNLCWGHSQFTSGGLTCSTVLMSWHNVGSVKMACKLIMAALKTCKITRHVCSYHGIKSGSYLSDTYLQNMVEKLWNHGRQNRWLDLFSSEFMWWSTGSNFLWMGQDKPPQPNAPGTRFCVIDKPSASVQPQPLVPSVTPLRPTICRSSSSRPSCCGPAHAIRSYSDACGIGSGSVTGCIASKYYKLTAPNQCLILFKTLQKEELKQWLTANKGAISLKNR